MSFNSIDIKSVLVGMIGTLLITGFIIHKYFISRQYLKYDVIYIDGKFYKLIEYRKN